MDTIETSAGGHLGDLDREFGYIPILQNLVCLDGEGERIGSVAAGSPLRLEITYKHEGPLKDPFFGITFENAAGVRIFSAQTQQNHGPLPDHNAEGVITCELPRLPLAPGIYFISLGIGSRGVLLDAVERAIRLEVIESDVFGTGFLLPTRHSLVLVDSLWRVDEKAIHVSSGAPSGLS